MENLIGLKEFMDNLVKEENFHITYASLRQSYKYGTLNEDISKYIIEKKKASSVSYYIDKLQQDKFKEALFKQFI